MKASVYDLASTGLTLALALLPTCAQAYREFEPGVVFAAAEPGDKEFGLDGFHLGESLNPNTTCAVADESDCNQITYTHWYESNSTPSFRQISSLCICTGSS